jgi:hypothetical protein
MSDNSDKTNVKNLIEMKNQYENKLIDILRKYFIRYIHKIYDNNDSLKKFQKNLIAIPEWEQNKIDKEYSKFIKNNGNTEEELSGMLNIIFGLNIQIMTVLFNPIEINVPKFWNFWYKCLKRIGKYYYEHPYCIPKETQVKSQIV